MDERVHRPLNVGNSVDAEPVTEGMDVPPRDSVFRDWSATVSLTKCIVS